MWLATAVSVTYFPVSCNRALYHHVCYLQYVLYIWSCQMNLSRAIKKTKKQTKENAWRMLNMFTWHCRVSGCRSCGTSYLPSWHLYFPSSPWQHVGAALKAEGAPGNVCVRGNHSEFVHMGPFGWVVIVLIGCELVLRISFICDKRKVMTSGGRCQPKKR